MSQLENGASPLVSVVMPCLNEEAGVGICIDKIRRVLEENHISGEIVVCDNASTDRSADIARGKGARVVCQPLRGYGHAYRKGFSAANGRYFIMVDADDTYDFELIPDFLKKLEEGCDFVTGSRALGGIVDHSMPALHRYLGNPLLTGFLNLFFGTHYTDVYCGYRAFTREAYRKLRPLSPGMEFNLELAINAGKAGLRIAEIPIKLYPRRGTSKLRTFEDGWRSLRMILLYSPQNVLIVPGLVLLLFGTAVHAGMLLRWIFWQGRAARDLTGIFAVASTVVGYQLAWLGFYARMYSWSSRYDSGAKSFFRKLRRRFTLERALLSGFVMAASGLSILSFSVWAWLRGGQLPLERPEWAYFGQTLLLLGITNVFFSIFFSTISFKAPGSRTFR